VVVVVFSGGQNLQTLREKGKYLESDQFQRKFESLTKDAKFQSSKKAGTAAHDGAPKGSDDAVPEVSHPRSKLGNQHGEI
jgi:hypothetical protein